jgi:hypothetical protein
MVMLSFLNNYCKKFTNTTKLELLRSHNKYFFQSRHQNVAGSEGFRLRVDHRDDSRSQRRICRCQCYSTLFLRRLICGLKGSTASFYMLVQHTLEYSIRTELHFLANIRLGCMGLQVTTLPYLPAASGQSRRKKKRLN